MHGGAPDLVEPQPPELRTRVRRLQRRRSGGGATRRYHALAAVPVLGLAVVIAALLVFEPIQSVTGTTQVDSITVERTVLEPGQIGLHVRNDGRVDTTVAQVLVNDAYWDHTVDDRELGRFEATSITLSYPWEEGIPLHLAVLTGAGTVVEHVVDNPTETVGLDGDTAATLGWVGLIVAPIPVALGLAWLPALRRSTGRVLGVVMAFTVGLLAFLLVDSAAEGLETASEAPDVFDGVGLFAVGALVALVVIAAAGTLGRSPRPSHAGPVAGVAEAPPNAGGGAGGAGAGLASGAVRLAWLVAAGIGLHNLGEGLAVGAAINTGEVALGTALVVAFALHNVTEGVAIAGPLGTSTGTRVLVLAGLVAVAGLPVFPGLWLGGFVLPAGWAALAFGVAAGAIAEVLWSMLQWLRRRGVTLTPATAGAFAGAVLFMYVTGLAAA